MMSLTIVKALANVTAISEVVIDNISYTGIAEIDTRVIKMKALSEELKQLTNKHLNK